ncbi:MAG: glycosyltransferase [Agriterribacter sp.]
MIKSTIDVVIPSFRLEEKFILPILMLPAPQNALINFYLIVDNPGIIPSAAIQEMTSLSYIHLIINNANIGASETRNKGIDIGTSDWILFLDDDISVKKDLLSVYADAIEQHPSEIGFIGMIELPEPLSAFTKAVKASGSMDIFGVAARKDAFAWGATANIMVSRKAIGNTRFSPAYPKSGGGEDVDFFLHVRENNEYKNYKTLPQAVVQHPWWNNETINFSRPFRYGKGNSRLGKLNPRYTYRDFLNTPETLLIALVVLIIFLFIKQHWVIPVFFFMAGVVLIECIASAVQTIKRTKSIEPPVIGFMILLRFAQEAGLLWQELIRLEWWRIGERFNDNGEVNKWKIFKSNTYRIIKWILYPLLTWTIISRHY